ncbi:unnamed protein product [Phytophthora lilii]|uniref:Unnamed protein product n=1 Tax=Phytophthora lilii TaxID=2077276 RepID=A0A9W6TIM8_9STRA|nr:unnamed protein product [Phytophthora lilii]
MRLRFYHSHWLGSRVRSRSCDLVKVLWGQPRSGSWTSPYAVVGPLEAHCNTHTPSQLGHPIYRYSVDECPASLGPLPGCLTSDFARGIESRHHQSPRPRATSRRSFADTGGARPPIQLSNQRRFSDSGGARPIVRVASKRSFVDSSGARPVVRIASRRSFADSGGARPVVRVTSKRSFADSTGSNSGIKVAIPRSKVDFNEVSSTPPENKANTRSRRASRSRNKSRKSREVRGKRRHRFLASLHDHGGHRFRLFCGCCVEKDAFDPGETPSFHWGVGFDDSYYHTSSYHRLSNGTRLRLELCGFHVTTRGRDPVELSVNVSSVGARAASFDSGFGFTCASPVSCPPPIGLVPTRLPTTLQLRSRDGTGSGKFTLNSGNSGFSSTGFKRKAPSSSSYPSYTPTTPPSPFMNDFLPAGTFNNTRARSRVSVGCNGWFLNDDDPSIVGWYRRRSSGEVRPSPIITHLSQVVEVSRESEAGFDREMSPKRYKKSPLASGTTSGVSSSAPASSPSASSPSAVTSPKPPLAPRSKTSSPANSRGSRVSILLLSQDGSISSSNGGNDWDAGSGIALVPLPMSPLAVTSGISYTITPPPAFTSSRSSYSSGLVSQAYDSALVWQGESDNVGIDDYGPPTKRRRSTGSSSNSSGGFGFARVFVLLDRIRLAHSIRHFHLEVVEDEVAVTAEVAANVNECFTWAAFPSPHHLEQVQQTSTPARLSSLLTAHRKYGEETLACLALFAVIYFLGNLRTSHPAYFC